MTLSFLIYLGIALLAALLCLWAGATAALRVPEHWRAHRLVTSLGATLLLPAAAAAALATPLGYPELAWGSVLLPPAVLACTWSNVVTLRDQGVLLKLAHLPTFLFNTALLGLYTVRALQDFAGQDLATWGGALTIAHVSLQTQIGQAAAAANPVWFHLPFFLPLCLRFRWPHVMVLVACSAVSSYLLFVLVMSMPEAHSRSTSYRGYEPPENQRLVPVPLGCKVPWGLHELPASTRWTIREALLDLNPRSVAVEVGPVTFQDEALLTQAKRELAWAREQGYRVVVFCRPPASMSVPAASLPDLRQQMAEAQWLAAERLRPDMVVLFSGPFGQLARTLSEAPTIDGWMRAIARSAREVRQANPKVKVAVSIESLAPHAADLFRRLKASGSPVDVVGLSIFPGSRLVEDLHKDLARLKHWVQRTPGNRRVEILETGCTPHAVGGELSQWHFLQRLLVFAGEVESIRAVTWDSLYDPASARGLLTWTGRRRLAFQELRRLTTGNAQPGQPGQPGK